MNQSKITEIRDVCFAKEYKNKQGEEKTHWTKVGVMFIKDNGGISLVLDAMPTGTNQLVAFKQKPRTSNVPDTPAYRPGEEPGEGEQPAPTGADGEEVAVEDIPF
jgi:hypothetical protein